MNPVNENFGAELAQQAVKELTNFGKDQARHENDRADQQPGPGHVFRLLTLPARDPEPEQALHDINDDPALDSEKKIVQEVSHRRKDSTGSFRSV